MSAVGDARKRLAAPALTLAEALCMTDDTWHHHDRTNDFPCTACVARAADMAGRMGGAL